MFSRYQRLKICCAFFFKIRVVIIHSHIFVLLPIPMEAAAKSEICIYFAKLSMVTPGERKVIYSIQICIMYIKFFMGHEIDSYCFL